MATRGCHVEVFKDGALIAAGDGMCSRTEETWRDRDDYALRGMAQTRATSRAIAGAAKWIVALAGYSTTPAEEYGAHEAPQGEPVEAGPEFGVAITPGQRERTMDAIIALVELDREAVGSVTAREAAKDAARAIIGRAGYLPAVVADALALVAAERLARRIAFDDQPPGEAPDGSVPMNDPRARELCICRDGLDTPQADTDDRCPLADHGVPF